jgi:hypothetical protein
LDCASPLALATHGHGHTRRPNSQFESGTQIAWIIDPGQSRVEVCHSLAARTFINAESFLDGEQLLPGFH